MISRDRTLLTRHESHGYLLDAYVDGTIHKLKIIEPITGKDLISWRFENECASDGEKKQVHELFKQLFLLITRDFDNISESGSRAKFWCDCDNDFLSLPNL